MRRTVFNEDHEAFRQTLRAFIESEVVPNYLDWLAAGIAPREFYYKLAELGLFGIEVPEEYGGAGVESFKFSAIESEETARAGVSFGGSGAHVALCLPYLLTLGTRRAEEAVDARVHLRRDDVRHRDDRAGHRLGPGGHANDRDAVRRRQRTMSSTAPRRSSPAACTPTG